MHKLLLTIQAVILMVTGILVMMGVCAPEFAVGLLLVGQATILPEVAKCDD